MAKLYKLDGTVEDIQPKNGKNFELKELYELINTDIIEPVYLPTKEVMIVDECGLVRENPQLNEKASIVAGTDIAGIALVCKQSQFK